MYTYMCPGYRLKHVLYSSSDFVYHLGLPFVRVVTDWLFMIQVDVHNYSYRFWILNYTCTHVVLHSYVMVINHISIADLMIKVSLDSRA